MTDSNPSYNNKAVPNDDNTFKLAKLCANHLIGMLILILVTGALSIANLSLTIAQLEPYNGGFTLTADSDFDTVSQACNSDVYDWFSPFRFDVGGVFQSCEWSDANTVFRIIIDSLTIISTLGFFYIFCKYDEKDNSDKNKMYLGYQIIRYCLGILSVASFAAFIIDTDHLRTGYGLCTQDFKVDGSQLIQIGNDDIDNCWLTPYIWTIFSDFGMCVFLFWLFLTLKFYLIKIKVEIGKSNVQRSKGHIQLQNMEAGNDQGFKQEKLSSQDSMKITNNSAYPDDY